MKSIYNDVFRLVEAEKTNISKRRKITAYFGLNPIQWVTVAAGQYMTI